MTLTNKTITLAIILLFLLPIWNNIKLYTNNFDISHWSDIYDNSQYCVPECEFEGNIDDPPLYQLAGYRYITGSDPSSINFELQPLTKYLFGISILILGNGLWIQLAIGALVLYVTFLITFSITKNTTFSLIPPLLLSIDKIFIEQQTHTYLDLALTLFILIFLYLLPKSLSSRNFKLPMIMLGFVALSKSFMLGTVLFAAGFLFLATQNKTLLTIYFKNSLFSVFTYLLGYFVFFIHHPNPLDFINLHIQIFRFYKSYIPEYPKGEIWRIIFSGQWRKWYDDFGLRVVQEWTIFWPISVLLSFYVLLKIKLRESPSLALHIIWTILYLSTLSLRLVFPRYLMPILPSLYIISSYAIVNNNLTAKQ